jgi:hypothetical protein
MNRMILAGARRGERVGALARLVGSPTLDSDTSRQERLNRLFAEREEAMQRGDEDALAFTEHRIDQLVDEARAARRSAESDQAEQPGFDGGVQRRPRPPVGGAMPTATELMRQALVQSSVERAAISPELRASNLKL